MAGRSKTIEENLLSSDARLVSFTYCFFLMQLNFLTTRFNGYRDSFNEKVIEIISQAMRSVHPNVKDELVAG